MVSDSVEWVIIRDMFIKLKFVLRPTQGSREAYDGDYFPLVSMHQFRLVRASSCIVHILGFFYLSARIGFG